MRQFDKFEKKIEAIRDKAAEHCEHLIRKELLKLHSLFPEHSFVFNTGMYGNNVAVDPPIKVINPDYPDEYEFLSEIDDLKIEDSKDLKMKKFYKILASMNEIATHLEDVYFRDIATVEISPDQAQTPTSESTLKL